MVIEQSNNYFIHVLFHPEIHVNKNNLKYVSLLTLTIQNALLGLSMRYSRTRDGDMFFSSTGNLNTLFHFSHSNSHPVNIISAVFMAELSKLLTCIVLVLIEEGTFIRFKASFHNAIIKNPVDTVST